MIAPATPPSVSGAGVFITNEGNFQFGNASISYYDIETGAVTNNFYMQANNLPLGDVCQSMIFFNGKGYIVLNNSAKIIVVDPVNFVQTGSITGFVAPRYFLPVSNSKAYVSDLHADAVSVVDLVQNTIVASIPVKGWTEEMAVVYGKAFVTNMESDHLFVINTSMDAIEDSIKLTYGSNSIQQDKFGKLWVLCSGNASNQILPALHRINPVTLQVEQSFSFKNSNDSPWKLDINGTRDTIYFLNKGVYKMAVSATALPAAPFIEEGARNYHGLGIEPKTGVVYIADAVDFVQKGRVYRYAADGTVLNSFLVGIIPNEFYFE